MFKIENIGLIGLTGYHPGLAPTLPSPCCDEADLNKSRPQLQPPPHPAEMF